MDGKTEFPDEIPELSDYSVCICPDCGTVVELEVGWELAWGVCPECGREFIFE